MREYMEWFHGFIRNLFTLFMGGLLLLSFIAPSFL